jgi:Na+-driven multidrug efflux pump
MRQWRNREVQLWQSEQQQQQQEKHAWKESSDSAPVVSNATSQVGEQQYQAANKNDNNAIIHKINNNNNNTALPPHPIALLSLPDRKSALDLIALAGPIFYVILAKVACYGAMTVRCTAFGVPAMAAHSIMMRIFFFFSTFGDSLSQTAQSFLPATLYPSPTAGGGGGGDRPGFAKILRRLVVVAVAVAVINSNIAVKVLQVGGKFLTRDPVIVGLMRQHTGFLGASILLHPLIMLLEGTVIASRKFRSLVIIYTGTLAWQLAALMFLTGSFPAIWRTFFLFQLTRLGLYTYRVVWWRQQQRKNSNSIEKEIAVAS